MSGSNTEQEWCLHLAEVICLFLKEQVNIVYFKALSCNKLHCTTRKSASRLPRHRLVQNAEELAKAGIKRSDAERQREGEELLQLRNVEEAKRRQNRSKLSPWYVCV